MLSVRSLTAWDEGVGTVVEELRQLGAVKPLPGGERGLLLGVLCCGPLLQRRQVGALQQEFLQRPPRIEQRLQAQHRARLKDELGEASRYWLGNWRPAVEVNRVRDMRREDLDVLTGLGITQDAPLPVGGLVLLEALSSSTDSDRNPRRRKLAAQRRRLALSSASSRCSSCLSRLRSLSMSSPMGGAFMLTMASILRWRSGGAQSQCGQST